MLSLFFVFVLSNSLGLLWLTIILKLSEDATPESLLRLLPKWSFSGRLYVTALSRLEALKKKATCLIR